MTEQNSLLLDPVLESAGQQNYLNSSNRYLIFPALSAVIIGDFSALGVSWVDEKLNWTLDSGQVIIKKYLKENVKRSVFIFGGAKQN